MSSELELRFVRKFGTFALRDIKPGTYVVPEESQKDLYLVPEGAPLSMDGDGTVTVINLQLRKIVRLGAGLKMIVVVCERLWYREANEEELPGHVRRALL